jgi:cytidine deaminase
LIFFELPPRWQLCVDRDACSEFTLDMSSLTHAARRAVRDAEPKVPVCQRDEKLIRAAGDVASNAYAPYSRFSVGAAVRTRSGAIYVGCNVENVSYPVGVCAERNAIAAAVAAEGAGMEIETVALVARHAGQEAACSPCGACRQAIGEFASAATSVLYRGPDLAFRYDPIGALLPGAFSFNPGDTG